MYDIIGFWLNFWLNPLRVSPLVGGRWVFHFSFFIFQIYVTCLIGGRSPWFADENVDPELELPGERQLERPPVDHLWSSSHGAVCALSDSVNATSLMNAQSECQVVWPHCGGLAPFTETPQIQRLRQSIGSHVRSTAPMGTLDASRNSYNSNFIIQCKASVHAWRDTNNGNEVLSFAKDWAIFDQPY